LTIVLLAPSMPAMINNNSRHAKKEYGSKDMQMLLELSPRQVLYWTEQFLGVPSVQDARGRGSSRIWSDHDVYYLFLAKYLIAFGLSFPAVRDILTLAKKLFPNWKKVEENTVLHIQDNRYAWVTGVDNRRGRVMCFPDGAVSHDYPVDQGRIYLRLRVDEPCFKLRNARILLYRK